MLRSGRKEAFFDFSTTRSAERAKTGIYALPVMQKCHESEFMHYQTSKNGLEIVQK